MAEVEPVGAIPSGAGFYDVIFASLTGPDLLILFGLAGVLLRFVAQDLRPRLPDPLTMPLIVLGLATLAGVATAYSAGAGVSVGELFHRSIEIGHLILIPLLAVNVLRDARALKAFAAGLAVLACLKGLTGLYASLGGFGSSVEAEVASFLNPFPNLLMLTFALGVIAALVRRVEIPGWMYVGLPITLLALLLSYRRSFWIAAILTIVLVVIIASRRRGRAVFAIGAVAVALALVATTTIPDSSDSAQPSPIAERAQTLTPSGIGSNRGDRYRIDERGNVVENLKDHPLTGAGLGVEWEVHQPLAEAHDRRYVHFAFLWYWLALGILGAIAYALLLGSSLWTGTQVWRRHPDPVVQVCAIAAFGAFLALGVVELTATFTGVEDRSTILVGGLLGWLAAAWQDLPARRAATG
ncbi:MAG TPA: O-antigen ligase family protein [Solirubrobacterales bacterium]|nr:O-antigen ligase family protein [Solirubrobacterales bacterium]